MTENHPETALETALGIAIINLVAQAPFPIPTFLAILASNTLQCSRYT